MPFLSHDFYQHFGRRSMDSLSIVFRGSLQLSPNPHSLWKSFPHSIPQIIHKIDLGEVKTEPT